MKVHQITTVRAPKLLIYAATLEPLDASFGVNGLDAASFDLENARPEMDENLAYKPELEVKMSINILAPDDGELTVNRQEQLSVKNAPAVHIQVMRIREEDEHLGEDFKEALNPKDRIAFLPIASQLREVFFGYSRPAFPSPLGMDAEVRTL